MAFLASKLEPEVLRCKAHPWESGYRRWERNGEERALRIGLEGWAALAQQVLGRDVEGEPSCWGSSGQEWAAPIGAWWEVRRGLQLGLAMRLTVALGKPGRSPEFVF